MSCKVIGVLEAKGTSGFGQDQDNVVVMPLVAFQRRIAGDRDVDTIYVAAADGVPTSTVQADIETILRETRRIAPGADDNFDVRDMTQIADAMTSATDDHDRHARRGGRRQPAGRRHRHHEHHAGVGDRAHARDRHPPRHRRA